MTERTKTGNTLYIELDNGSVIAGERKSDTRTVSLAFAIKGGSADETDEESGISHFVEHALFKGTTTRGAFDLKEPIERVGGGLNAYTGRISTVFYAKVPDTHGKVALEILEDMIRNPQFSDTDIDLEKNVVLEEIATSEDDPFDRIYDMTVMAIWDKDFGRPIQGFASSVEEFTKRTVLDYYQRVYNSGRLMFAIAGNFEDGLLDCVTEFMESFPPGERTDCKKSPTMNHKPVYLKEKRSDLQQVHILLSKQSPGRSATKDYEAFKIVNTLLGSGMSSILFHELREKLGLVYQIDSEFVSYHESGTLFISAVTGPKNLRKFVDHLEKELKKLVHNGITESQFNYGKERLRGKLLMSTEGTLQILSREIDETILCGRPKTIEEILSMLDKITADDLNSVLSKYLTGPWNCTLLLPQSIGAPEDLAFSV